MTHSSLTDSDHINVTFVLTSKKNNQEHQAAQITFQDVVTYSQASSFPESPSVMFLPLLTSAMEGILSQYL